MTTLSQTQVLQLLQIGLEKNFNGANPDPIGLTEALWLLSHWNHSGLEMEMPEWKWAQEEDR